MPIEMGKGVMLYGNIWTDLSNICKQMLKPVLWPAQALESPWQNIKARGVIVTVRHARRLWPIHSLLLYWVWIFVPALLRRRPLVIAQHE